MKNAISLGLISTVARVNAGFFECGFKDFDTALVNFSAGFLADPTNFDTDCVQETYHMTTQA